MIRLLLKPLFLLCIIAASLNTTAQFRDKSPVLTVDPGVKIGKLPNGLTYYIRKNAEPKNRMELRLVVNAGSVLEDEKQRGLAHFVEHMAFNGTKNFKKQELVDFLEKAGVNFGADLNAYTSYDETVYELQIPTDDRKIFLKSFQILEDWAHQVSFEPAEIDKERGVIIEEWRLGRGADARMRDKMLPVVLSGSQYAKRLPIGTKENLETFKHETLRQFYRDWYRPDLMSVMAVGDFDPAEVEKIIKEKFGKIQPVKQPRRRVKYSVPDHTDTKTVIITDKEQPYTVAQIYYKLPRIPGDKTENEYRSSIVRRLFNQMINARLSEITQKPNPPFAFGGSSYSSLLGDKDAFSLFAVSRTGKDLSRAISTLITENERVKRFGFTEGELERAKKQVLSSLENAFNERNKTESRNYVEEYIRNFLSQEPIPGIEKEFELNKKMIPGIQLAEVNELIKFWIRPTNRAVVIMAPDKEKADLPAEKDLLALLAAPAPAGLTAYEDIVNTQPLITSLPPAGKIISEKAVPELGLVELKLSNGLLVVVKATDFKNDEIEISCTSPGGMSLYPNADLTHLQNATQVLSAGGIGQFDAISLNKQLAGRNTFVSPFITPFAEGLYSRTTPKELETAMQLLHLYFTAPRKDTAAFGAWKSRTASILQNQSLDPGKVFSDTVSATLFNYNPRMTPLTVEKLMQVDADRSLALYRERFANAGDFVVIFTGAVKLELLKPFLEKYIASLPAVEARETWKDNGVRYAAGKIEKTVKKGTEPKSTVRVIYTGSAAYSDEEQTKLDMFCKVLSIKLREKLREEASGVYGVGFFGSINRFQASQYSISLAFGCSPDNVEKLMAIAMKELEKVKQNGAEQTDIDKVIAEETRTLEVSLRENSYWLNNLQQKYMFSEDPKTILDDPKLIKMLTREETKRIANQYLNDMNRIKLVLMPE